MAKTTIETYRDGELVSVEEADTDEIGIPVAEPEPEMVMEPTVERVTAKRLEIAPDTLGGRTSLVLTADDGSRMELYVTPDGTIGVTPL